ncbi:hypothetical protein PMJ10TS2_39780 [Paenibacillus melissococcoides]
MKPKKAMISLSDMIERIGEGTDDIVVCLAEEESFYSPDVQRSRASVCNESGSQYDRNG